MSTITSNEAFSAFNAGLRESKQIPSMTATVGDEHRDPLEDAKKIVDGLASRRMHIDNPPPEVESVIRLNDIGIAQPGNLIPATGQSKHGKTRIAEATLASAMSPRPHQIDSLGLLVPNPDGKAVIYIDAEMGEADSHRLLKLAMMRAGISEQPDWLYHFHMTGMDPEEIKDNFHALLEVGRARHGEILFSYLDGVTDMMRRPNDEEEAIAITTWCHRRAIEFQMPILGVIHNNAGSDNPKMRGHVGSQWERKCQTALKVKKDTNDVITLWTYLSRGQGVTESNGSRFKWDEGLGMFASVESKGAVRVSAQEEKNWQLVHGAFKADAGLTHKELVDRIMEQTGSEYEAARKRLSRLRDSGFVKVQVGTGYYHKGDSRPC